VAGHDYQISTVGSRIILNTLLNLGQAPISNERALSAPTVYVDANGAKDSTGAGVTGSVPLAFTGVYDVISGVSSGRFIYSWASGSQWLFPKTPGNVYEHGLVTVGSTSGLGQGSFTFGSGALWDAQAQLASRFSAGSAGTRNVFTYFGGQVATGPGYPNGALQTGWKPSPVSPAVLTNASCVDVLSWGKVSDGKHAPYFGLISGTPDGVCDLEEATQLILVSGGTDFGAGEWTTNKAALALSANVDNVRGMLAVVQGYCFATSTHGDGTGSYVAPSTLSQCNATLNPVNNPTLGGIVHSTPAVVGPSPNVADLGASRPTVLYAAGADGEIHAFYVSGGAGYTGPGTPVSGTNPTATSAFANNWLGSGSFSAPKPMTELWAYMPASQLPLLATNAQMIDSAPVVEDVFADFTGSGVRQWRTVLVATTGSPLGNPGAEVFALDVTNPLAPMLLWDVMGSWTGPSGTITPVALANNASTASQKVKWVQTNRGASYPAIGNAATGLYDYSELGSSYGLSLGMIRSGSVPFFPVYLSSNFAHDTANAPLTNGVQVYAINAATGQKMWHWQQPYAITGNVPGDPVPQPVTLLPDAFGSLKSVYIVDLEGHLWELPASAGADAWTGKGVASSGAIFATSGTAEPLTTPIAIARLPSTFGSSAALSAWPSQLIALAGTDGSSDTFVDANGQLHVVNIDPSSRPATGIGPPDPTPTFPITVSGQRVYGQITIAGQTAFFSTAAKPVTDPLSVDPGSGGATYQLDLGNAAGAFGGSSLPYFSTQALYGGVSVYYDASAGATHVLGLQVAQLSQTIVTNAPTNAALATNSNKGLLYQLLGWVRRALN
ncbi:MAG TPA: hypothetical protein VH208_04290, partial [Myxococcaceae bacterium]|nr:hypothetical protein [Myxococcaceae bacterium]